MYNLNFNKPIHVHFIGIGGISMSGLAQILLARGFTVTGSDSHKSQLTRQLESLGAKIMIGQRAENITKGIDLVVYTAAIHLDNEEYDAARKAGIPMITRATLLGQIMDNFRKSVAVAGTHGKTTTTSMITHILLTAEMDPTVSVGGMLDRIGGNIRVGRSPYFLTEACEYTNSFLEFYPLVSVILNVEEDHLDFFKDLEEIKQSFHTFASQTKEGGTIIINGDMAHTEEIIADIDRKIITFGLMDGNDYQAKNIIFDELGNGAFSLYLHGQDQGRIKLSVKGRHNISNSLAAIAVALEMGIDLDKIRDGLLSFGGTHRRFEYKGSIGNVSVVDDYAHHPTEISATLEAAADYPHDDMWVVFQPHTYTRTKAFLQKFASALAPADHVILAKIYAARERDTGEVSSDDINQILLAMGKDSRYIESFAEIEAYLFKHVKGNDLILTMGAGDVVDIADEMLAKK